MKKIYFACSIAGGRDHDHLYEDIVKAINGHGVKVLSERFTNKKLVAEEAANAENILEHIHDRDMAWVKEYDAVIAEVTQPSLGVGYEIGQAEVWNKPILALFYEPSGKRLSPMISGSKKVTVARYNNHTEAKAAIKDFLDKI